MSVPNVSDASSNAEVPRAQSPEPFEGVEQRHRFFQIGGKTLDECGMGARTVPFNLTADRKIRADRSAALVAGAEERSVGGETARHFPQRRTTAMEWMALQDRTEERHGEVGAQRSPLMVDPVEKNHLEHPG